MTGAFNREKSLLGPNSTGTATGATSAWLAPAGRAASPASVGASPLTAEGLQGPCAHVGQGRRAQPHGAASAAAAAAHAVTAATAGRLAAPIASVEAGLAVGAAGIGIGSAVTRWPMVLGWQAVVYPSAISMGIAVIFGAYPALRAARLDPILALNSK